MAEKVGSNRPAFAFLFPRYSLGKCSAFESHLHNKKAGTLCPLFYYGGKGGEQSSGLTFLFPRYSLGKCSATNPILLWRKRWGAIVRPRISDSSLFAREMLGDESHRLSGKGGDQSSGLRISFSSLFAREMLGDESHLPLKRRKRRGPIVRPRISDSSLTLKEMLGDESHRLSGKGGYPIVRPRISFSSLTLKEMSSTNPTA